MANMRQQRTYRRMRRIRDAFFLLPTFASGFAPCSLQVQRYARTNCPQKTSTTCGVGFDDIDLLLPKLFDDTQSTKELVSAVKIAAQEETLSSLGHDVITFLAASVAVVPISQLLKITPVLGFLIFGAALGPYGLDVFSNSEADLVLGDVGILFLLFSEGLNLSPQKINQLGTFSRLGVQQLIVSMGVFFLGLVLGGPIILQYIAPFLHMDDDTRHIFTSPIQAFCVASAGALSSSAFVLPVLKEKKWEERPEGVAALSVLLLQDLAVAPLLVVLPLLAGSEPTVTELATLVTKATFGFGAALYLGSIVLRYVFDIVAAARSTETFVAAALIVALGMGQVAEYLGLSATTGAFAAGVLLAGNRYRAQIKADIRPFEGILLGIFFLTAGASLDPTIIFANAAELSTGIVVFILVKAAVLFLSGPAVGETPAQAARVAITLSGGGEFSIVVFKLARSLGLLDAKLESLLTASVVISMSLTPLLGSIADGVGNYLESLEGGGLVVEGGPLTQQDAQGLFDEIDTDNSGCLDFEELRVALVQRGLNYASVGELFTAFDKDGNGSISREEWEDGLKQGLLAAALRVGRKVPGDQGSPLSIARNAIVICGFGKFGKELYEVLDAAGLSRNGGVVAFDLNPTRLEVGMQDGENVIYGDSACPGVLRAAGVQEPRAVIVTFRSESKRLDATARLRASLPEGTPIFVRVISGQSIGRDEFLKAGATDIVDERTESAIRFGELVGAYTVEADTAAIQMFRNFSTINPFPTLAEERIPGFPIGVELDLADEFACSPEDIERLYELFASVPSIGDDQSVAVDELRDVLLRTDDFPLDDASVSRWTKLADGEYNGKLSFLEFARAYFGVTKTLETSS